VAEVRTRALHGPADAAAPLGSQRAEVVHLLEERGQIFRLRDGDVIPKLEHALLVERAAFGRRYIRTCGAVKGSKYRRQELELFAHDSRALVVIVEAGHSVERGSGS
jgi:hypothetical protein